jgi:hypothetical protein
MPTLPSKTSLRAAPGQRISVGVNYPWAWNKFGVYFGSGESVPGDHPAYDVWLTNLDRNLGRLRAVGVSVVRMFLFCNANNLGSTKPGRGPVVALPVPAAAHDVAPTFAAVQPWSSFVPPATVSPIYAEQLDGMLRIFNRHGMKVIPSLASFEAFAQGPNASGRTDIIVDPETRAWFLANVVDPLLDVAASRGNDEAIFAWEVMNEPGQVTDSPYVSFLRKTDFPIPRWQMATFLADVIARFEGRGFQSTVGHHHAGDLTLPTGSLRQFHYYPQSTAWLRRFFVPSRLPPQEETLAFVGEFPSAYIQPDQRYSVPWPEIAASVESGDALARTVARLRLLEAKGYGVALLWPDTAVDFDPATAAAEPLQFSQPVLDGIAAYLQG